MTHTEASAAGTGSWRLMFILAPAKVTLLLGSGLGQQTVLVGRHPDQCNKPCLEGSQRKRQKRPHTTQGECLDFIGECGGFFFLSFFLTSFLIFFLFVKILKDLGKDLSHYENVILSNDTAVASQGSQVWGSQQIRLSD